jgi:hypothetical protein
MIRRLEKIRTDERTKRADLQSASFSHFDIRSEEKKPSITEGMIRQTMDIPVKQTLEAKIIGFPTNKFLRIIRFEDGTEGKFKCKPSKHRKMGEQVSVRLIEGDMWLLVR